MKLNTKKRANVNNRTRMFLNEIINFSFEISTDMCFNEKFCFFLLTLKHFCFGYTPNKFPRCEYIHGPDFALIKL